MGEDVASGGFTDDQWQLSTLEENNLLPDEQLPGFREAVSSYAVAIERLARALLPAYAIALHQEPNFFDGKFDKPCWALRLNCYPPTEAQEVGIPPHADGDFCTFLLQDDQPGLSVLRSTDGKWVQAPTRGRYSLLVNSGNTLMRLSNDAARDATGGPSGAPSLAAGPFNAGARAAYAARFAAELARVQARPDLPPTARWADSHCHLESILQRTWRGGGKPQVTDREEAVGLEDLISSWPGGMDACICNCVFRRPSKPGFPPEWDWLRTEEPAPLRARVAARESPLVHRHPPARRGQLGFRCGEHSSGELGRHAKCVGIGECGLDFFKHTQDGEADLQLGAFRAQAALAVELGRALVVHARLVTRSNEALCLGPYSRSSCPASTRCTCTATATPWPSRASSARGGPTCAWGSQETRAITFKDRPGKGKSKGRSASGVVEEKGEAHCRELVQGLPLERLLIETDGPYMCPEPFRGQTAHPGHVHRVAEKIAEWQGRSLGEVMDATRRSTAAVYGV
ncbi:unnamed protein product [Prorocentrum cordatum]|uniref:Fe2OG dioxygenase domain-containing protein n=1 Tax=Prorocentrum cordatum TaxID=2364126 RepID=A0ABN9PP59_9DINO|nr:unnamed protein product [Polarella glacialis]